MKRVTSNAFPVGTIRLNEFVDGKGKTSETDLGKLNSWASRVSAAIVAARDAGVSTATNITKNLTIETIPTGFTQGSVIFAEAGGFLEEDNANLFWDDSLNRIRIGPVTGLTADVQTNFTTGHHSFSYLKSGTNARTNNIYNAFEDSTTDNQVGEYTLIYATHTSGTKSLLAGKYVDVVNHDNGSVTSLYGIVGAGWHIGSGTTGTMAALFAASGSKTAGTITNNYGLLVGNQTVGASNWAIKTGTGTVQFGDAVIADVSVKAPFFQSAAADVADAGAIRLGNGEAIAWEASPASTDVTLSVNASEQLVSSNDVVISTMTEGSILFASASGLVSQDNANLFWDDAGNVFRLNGTLQGQGDDVFLAWDAGANRVGMTKKNGFVGKFTHGSAVDFIIARSSTATIAGSSTYTDELTIDTSGNATFTGNVTAPLLQTQQSTLGNATLLLQSTATNDDPNFTVYQARVATTDGTATVLHTVPITANRTYYINAKVIARRTGGAAGTADDGAGYDSHTFWTTKTGTVTQLGGTFEPAAGEDQAGWGLSYVVSGANVQIKVTGAANNNVTWHGTISVSYVGS